MRRWRAVLARLGERTPAGRDTVVAAVLIVLGFLRIPLALLINNGSFPASGWVIVGANLAATADVATLALRRRAPRTALALAIAVVLASTALPAMYVPTGIGVVVCAYTVATLAPRRQAIIVLAAATAAHAVGGIVSAALGGHVRLVATFWANDGRDPVDLLLASIGTFAIPGMIGLYVRVTRAYTEELTARVERLQAERESRAKAAAAEERGRIARELHDIAAHDLSAIVVQAGAADRLLDRDPAAARAALRSIRSQGRRTLTALRGLVGIMRASDVDDDELAPQPSLSTVDELVRSARESGMTVELSTRGQARPLPAATDLAAYRLIQEALTNARRHASGTAVEVTVEYRDVELLVSVHNGPGRQVGPTNGEVYGLLGMRERVRHTGGSLVAGPKPDGGWQVDARFPVAP